ncbi:nucleoside deaminase [Nonomuraea candida]|uniref:nucleoside deaminase n=1 Tax=Nonomuraea candida TaxID=359159 RepID=UPI0006944422|nr:nucleoside deaminase [Nonomuraea candida]
MRETHPNARAMGEAITVAGQAAPSGNYRIGAIVVDGGMKVLGSAFTELHSQPDPTAHAEILALRRACAGANCRYLPGCFLYSTLEPCPMCTSAAIWAKLEGIVYGATLEDAADFARRAGPGFSWRQIDIKSSYVITHGTPLLRLHEEFMRAECLKLVSS